MIIEINTIDKTIIIKSEFQLPELTEVVQLYNLWDYKIIMDKEIIYGNLVTQPITQPIIQPYCNPYISPDIIYRSPGTGGNPVPPFFTSDTSNTFTPSSTFNTNDIK